MVVGAPNVDHALEAADLELAQEVAEVGREVCRLARGTDHHPVLVVRLLFFAVAEPDGAFPVDQVARLAQALDGQLGKPLLPERALPVPLVVPHAQTPHAGRQLVHHAVDREATQARLGGFEGQVLDPGQRLARFIGDHRDVVAAIPVLRWLLSMQPRIHGLAEQAGLGVLVVDVVLALDGMAGEGEHAGDGIAEDHAAPVPDVEGAGGVNAGEFDLDLLALAQVAGSVARPLPRHPRHQLAQPGLAQPEVDVAAGTLGRRFGNVDALGELPRDLRRRALEHPRQLEPRATGVVAVLAVPGPHQLHVGDLLGRHAQGSDRRLQRGANLQPWRQAHWGWPPWSVTSTWLVLPPRT